MKSYYIKLSVLYLFTLLSFAGIIFFPADSDMQAISLYVIAFCIVISFGLYPPIEFYRSGNDTKIAEAILEQLRNNVNDFTARKSPNNMSDSIVNVKGTVEINIEDLSVISPASIYFSPEEKPEIREIIKTILDNDTNKIIESL